jgi:hypothetical protein
MIPSTADRWQVANPFVSFVVFVAITLARNLNMIYFISTQVSEGFSGQTTT